MVALSALLVFSCLGCRDDITGTRIHPPLGGARLHENYLCSVDVVAESTTCRAEMTAPSAGGPARAVYPSAQVAPSFRRAVYTAADSVYRTEVKMWNNTTQPLGTRDGSTISGVKVFFQTTPRVTLYRDPGDTAPPTGRETPLSMGDSGIVKVRNADGSQTFTALNQPYFTYPQIIDVGWASEYKEWQFTVPPNVARFDFTVRVFAATPNEPLVPAVAPDTAPQEIFQSKYHMADTAWITGTFLRHVVRLAFQEAATQEERQSAVDLVQGEVVGGMSLGVGDGLYLVRIPDNRSVSNPVRNAIEKLESLPQVDFATVLFVDNQFTGQYRLPVDGPNFEAESWNINPDSASGINWPLEAISAPLAWGCSQGDSTSRVPIGVVDTHLKVVPDLAPNVTRRFGVGLVAGGGHGTAVTSILGARGNNRLDMTGVLWHADLRLYEVGVDSLARAVTDSTGKPQFHDFNLAQRISMAAREGAAVVNLSLGLDWTHRPGSRAGDSARVQRVYPIFRRTARSLLASGKLPLIVISAGNDTVDAYWNGLTLLRRDFPDNVIVVANAAKAGPARLRMAHNSNHGTLVDIAAPGDTIVGIDNNDQYRLWSGTSFAAPFVSGTAGLLFSFDPSLRHTPALVKQLILAGARRTGRRIQNGPGTDSLPVLDAYAALKEAGGRRGAPLCGNRVWASRGKITVERGPGLGDEVIYAEGESSDYIMGLVMEHGGRRARFYRHPSQDEFDLTYNQGGNWSIRPSLRTPFDTIHAGRLATRGDSTLRLQEFRGTMHVQLISPQFAGLRELAVYQNAYAGRQGGFSFSGREVFFSFHRNDENGPLEVHRINLDSGHDVALVNSVEGGSWLHVFAQREDGREFAWFYQIPHGEQRVEFRSTANGALSRALVLPIGNDALTPLVGGYSAVKRRN